MECVRYSIGFGGYRCTRSNEFKHLKRSLVIEKCVREFIGFRERLLHIWYQISKGGFWKSKTWSTDLHL